MVLKLDCEGETVVKWATDQSIDFSHISWRAKGDLSVVLLHPDKPRDKSGLKSWQNNMMKMNI